MPLRTLLLGLVLAATVAFAVGVAVERSSGDGDHHETPATATAPATGGEGGETTERHAAEQAATPDGAAAGGGQHAELRPLGIDVEAWPFVALAAVTSVALAAAAWLRPRAVPLLGLLAFSMLAFAVLDVREVFHQADIGKDGLAVIAGAVAALHLASVTVSAIMASQARDLNNGTPVPPGTMPA